MRKILVFVLLFASTLLIGCNGSGSSDESKVFGDGLLAVEKDNLCGYINKDGEVVIELQFVTCGRFFDGEAIVNVGGAHQLIDTDGNEILSKSYAILLRDEVSKSILYWDDEYEDSTGWGLMDKDGEIIVDPIYQKASISTNGLFRVGTKKTEKYINGQGEDIFGLEFQRAYDFGNGFAAVVKNDKYGYIDEKGELVIDYQYDTVNIYFDDYGNTIVTEINDSDERVYHLINTNNEKIISDAKNIKGKGPYYAVKFDYDTRIYDYEGNLFSQEIFPDVHSMTNRILTTYDYLIGIRIIYLNEDGSIKVSVSEDKDYYMLISEIDDKLIYNLVVMDDGEVFIYNDENTYNLEVFRVSMILDNETFIGIKDDSYGIIDKDNKIILDFDYEFLTLVNNEYYIFTKNDLMGLMDLDFNIVIDLEYDSINTSVNIFT